MEKMETDGNAMEGNTKYRVVPSMYWSLTLNNWSEEELETIIKICKEKEFEYLIGKEVGKEGTPHLQGYISSKKKIRANETFGNKRIHWEKCGGSKLQNEMYCTKEGIWVTNMASLTVDPLQGVCLYPWQAQVVKMIKDKPDPRKIYWYWEKEGCTGKTSLAKHLCLRNSALYVNGKAADVKCAIAEMVKNGKEVKTVIFGIPRSAEDYVSYGALEEVKDGIFFSGKYESGMVIYNVPHVIVFANFKPDVNKLSKDRWEIKNIGDEPCASPAPARYARFGLDD